MEQTRSTGPCKAWGECSTRRGRPRAIDSLENMQVKVLFFGLTHDLTGFAQEQLDLPEGETLDGLWRRYEVRFPSLSSVAHSLLVSVNEEIAPRSRDLHDGDEVAFMPPVSGGTSDDFFQLTHDSIPTSQLTGRLKGPADGAVVVFEGIVRSHSHNRRTLYLEYEAYEPLAVRKMEEIGRRVKQRFAIDRIGIIHRLGRLRIGETSVAIIVASAHRRAAFEAAEYAIDHLKQVVPVWKKEYFDDGAVWAEGEGQTKVLVQARK